MSNRAVGSYVLVEKLGEGGMGEVYLADHKYIARRAAIKFLLRDLSGSTELVGRFFAEARAASVIKHPGIVEVLDCDVHEDGRAYIVMELLRGESLRDYIERVGSIGRDEAGALSISNQIASALAAAHAQEIIHRDLKPDNVFLHVAEGEPADQPIAKILDFGIAKLMGRGEGGTKTRTGQLLGTPMYMSPEQCRGAKQIDNRSDIYSLGCIMYEIFCGRAPFLDEGFGDLIIAHVSRPPPEPLHAAPWISAPSRRLLLDCLAKDPADRPQSMRDVVNRLVQMGASDSIHLQVPVSTQARPHAPAGPAPEGRTSSAPRSGPRLAQTTPMPGPGASGLVSHTMSGSSGSGRVAPAAAGAPTITPSGVGRTRFLQTDPNTLHEGASESYQPTLRGRGHANRVAVIAAAVGAVALAALVILRVLTTQPPVARDTTATQDESTAATGSNPSNARAGNATAEAEARAQARATQPPPPPPPLATSVISLVGLPPDALVRLDGHAVNPPVAVPREAQTHQLIVDANGYQRWETSFDARADHTVTVDMKKLASTPSAARAAGARPRKRGERGSKPADTDFDGFTDL